MSGFRISPGDTSVCGDIAILRLNADIALKVYMELTHQRETNIKGKRRTIRKLFSNFKFITYLVDVYKCMFRHLTTVAARGGDLLQYAFGH